MFRHALVQIDAAGDASERFANGMTGLRTLMPALGTDGELLERMWPVCRRGLLVLLAGGQGMKYAAARARRPSGKDSYMSEHSGQWQADGDELKTGSGKQRVEWGQDTVPTKDDGRRWLADVASKLTKGERKRREPRACKEAKKFIRRSPPEGYPSTMRRWWADDDKPSACIDLEIYGLAFCDV